MDENRPNVPDADFVRLVRGALTHLYDPAYLQNHPLISRLGLDLNLDKLTRAQELRRILIEGIEHIQPRRRTGKQSEEAIRAYTILTYRYVDGLSMEEIGEELDLSQRSLYREHKKGLEAVACLLWDRAPNVALPGEQVTVTSEAVQNRLDALQAELNHIQPAVRVNVLDIEPVLQEVLEMLNPLVAQTGRRITLVAPGQWPAVMADRIMLRQIFLVLLSNMLYTGSGNLAIECRKKKNEVVIVVAEGAKQPQTEPPPAVDPSNDANLAVVQTLVETLGGRLELLREDGWRVRLFLPGSTEGATVLMVEDNEGVVSLFRRYLGGHQVSIVDVNNGDEAIEQAIALQPRVITLDLMMPDEDGWEILQRLKKNPATEHIPVVICSVLNEPQLAEAMGASGYITKPVDRIEILEALQNYLGPLLPTV
ncbi:MAG: response regulator [Chloroflexi bacterium]|nr:MAG: response regulator [Chloroflexota bacterium]